MTVVGAALLFFMIWVVSLIVSLQLGQVTQAESKDVAPGTPASAPANFDFRRKLLHASLAAVLIWAVISAIIISGAITLADIDIFKRLRPSS